MAKQIMALLSALFILTPHLFAEGVECASGIAEKCNASFSVDVMSKYLWRGTIMNDNPCWQPNVTFGISDESWGGIYAGVWSSLDMTHKRNNIGGVSQRKGGMQELDFYAGYAKSVGNFDFDFAHWWYTYPNDNFSQYNELYGSISYNNEILVPGAEVWWAYQNKSSFDEYCYFNFYVRRAFTLLDDKLTVTPKASLGFSDSAFTRSYVVDWRGVGANGNGVQMTDQTLSPRMDYAITANLSVAAHINYTWIPSHTLRHERWMTYGHDSRSQIVWGGIGVTMSF